MAEIPDVIKRILSATRIAAANESMTVNSGPTPHHIDVQPTSSLYTYTGGSSCSAISASSVVSNYMPQPSRSLKERMRKEILDDLRTEGLLKTKSDLKEVTSERMARKIDSVLKKAEKND